MKKKDKPGGKDCVRRQCLFEDRSSWNPQRHCKALTKPMVVNGLNYNLAEKLIREKKVNYV